ncbi:MAG: PT domain-containing protein [Clostridia bacterium]|nr:PT domain-containing protein [Clostridia bacterium]
MKKLVTLVISALLATLFLGCTITQIVPLRPTKAPTEAPTEVPTEAPTPVPTPRPLYSTYAPESKALFISGSSGYSELVLPEGAKEADSLYVDDDDFIINARLLKQYINGDEPSNIELKDMIDRTDKSLAFIREYLSENASAVYPEDIAAKPVVFNFGSSQFGWWVEDERVYIGGEQSLYVSDLRLTYSSIFSSRERLYVLALINSDSVGWEQLGFAQYFGDCVSPYGEQAHSVPLITPDMPFYDAAVRLGYSDDGENTPAIMRGIYDVIARAGFEYGLGNWGTTMTGKPVSYFVGYTRKYAEVNSGDEKLSLAMAISFVAWLDGEYGFDALSRFCFGQMSFDEAFKTDYQTAFDAWRAYILETCPEL